MTAATDLEIHGTCDPRFEPVREAFARNFEDAHEVGASVAVTLEGEFVVDLWAGHADGAGTRPWGPDTIVNVFSCTKGMAALCAHMLVDRGLLDLDAPVAQYWPEFAQAGKERLPVHYLLSHRAGLPAVRADIPDEHMYDWVYLTAAIAAEEPWWEPGTQHGYHARTYGWLVGEVVRRVSGKTLGTFFREEVAEPLDADFRIGFGPEHDHRVGEMLPMPGAKSTRPAVPGDPASMQVRAFGNPRFPGNATNTREWRAAEMPSSNGHGNGRSMARVYAALALGGELDGVRLLSREQIEAASVEQSNGTDAVVGIPLRFGLGFRLPLPDVSWGPKALGHSGAGGSAGFADPEARISFGYAMNQMLGPEDPRANRLAQAVYASL